MSDAIAHALVWVLSRFLRRRPGRHSAAHLGEYPTPLPEANPCQPAAHVSPWSRPWTSPSKKEAAAFFRRQSETTLELHAVRERRRALSYATHGIDYPYTYDGAPFPQSAFTATELSA